MKGVVFSELLDWIEQCHGVEVLDEVLLAAELPCGGAYTSAATYDWRELTAIVDVLAARTGGERAAILHAYGRHLFRVFAGRFADVVGAAATPYDLLAGIGARIEQEVAKLYSEPQLPRFSFTLTGSGLVLEYRSMRPLADLAAGLVEACFAHYAVPVAIRADGDAHQRRFEITELREAMCPTGR
ncbi:MAG: heme NO-binding domain-containing protein [Planctomycetes bacterium]|nr:heme NO-binding domain-containing protein [Planctomycetota bacterium]